MANDQSDDKTDLLILLAEDSDSDAYMIEHVLTELNVDGYTLARTKTLKETLAWISTHSPEVVLLDMNLGDSSGINTVEAVYAAASDATIIVLTGSQHGDLAFEALEAGAQDYLGKDEINDRNLGRILSFELSRRKFHLRKLEQALTNQGALSTLNGNRPKPESLKLSDAAFYDAALKRYGELLINYLDSLVLDKAKPEADMHKLVEQLGAAGAGPKDIMDIHVTALEQATANARTERAYYLNTDGRLLALEVMGHLVAFYRAGSPSTVQNTH